ncbi:hypothetical protein B0J11DRAFT_552437 [Dendryphion nanum]|uniref:rRNA biogenesis protein RRP36 n=1 Tax=Dendryphion nanum TaxID=256645 RepID=A0A9P9DE78_9PLEO|nr:hypothetical protein B0J11DRAFT_552437 [Dendryphion nanum]
MPLSTKLERKLRAAEEEDDESDDLSYYEVSDRSSPSIVETGEDAEIVDSENKDNNEHSGNEEDEDEESSDDDVVQQQLSKVSFGALAKAQDALAKQQNSNRKRKRDAETGDDKEDKLQALRQRLQEIKAAKLAKGAQLTSSKKPKTSTKVQQAQDGNVDDLGGGSDSEDAPRARSSKHAPMKQTSKRPVGRRRDVYEVKKSLARDPRFDNAVGGRPDDTVLKNRYAFLNDYRESEMAELRTAIKKTKDEDDKEKLKRKLLSMESQKKTQQNKDKQQEIIREHRKKEKEMVKQGKQPFYLKKSEQKKLVLIDRFDNMKAKERDKVIERRRKKASAKERKNMPDERRMA